MSAESLLPILIVDDSEDDFEAMERALRHSGGLPNPVRHFDNGKEALDYIFQRDAFAAPAAAPRPLLVLLDLNMPGIDGRSVLSEIKSDPQTTNIPVVILTTSDSPQDIAACYKAGANTYVQKPVTMPALIEAIDTLKQYWLRLALLPVEK